MACVYHSARANPQNFYIGIDPNCQPLEKISEKICRQPARGGAQNAMYIQASAENLPEELDGIAGQVEVLFPCGSLLQAMIAGESHVLRGTRLPSKSGSQLSLTAQRI